MSVDKEYKKKKFSNKDFDDLLEDFDENEEEYLDDMKEYVEKD